MNSTLQPARLDPGEMEFEYYRSSGPGGQNVNKVSTAVRLRFDLRRSASLPDDVKERLARIAGDKLTAEGVLIIEAQRYRSQERNQQDAVARLERMVVRAWTPPKPRRPTRPTRASTEKRIQDKKRRSQRKRDRQTNSIGE